MFEKNLRKSKQGKRKRGRFAAMLESSKAGPDEDAREQALVQAASRLMVKKFIEDIMVYSANNTDHSRT
jgi:hypothetical protein